MTGTWPFNCADLTTIKKNIYIAIYIYFFDLQPKFQNAENKNWQLFRERRCKGASFSDESRERKDKSKRGRLKAIRLISRYYLTPAGGNVIATMCVPVAKTNGCEIEQLPRNGILIISALTRYFNALTLGEIEELLCEINEEGRIIVLMAIIDTVKKKKKKTFNVRAKTNKVGEVLNS